MSAYPLKGMAFCPSFNKSYKHLVLISANYSIHNDKCQNPVGPFILVGSRECVEEILANLLIGSALIKYGGRTFGGISFCGVSGLHR